MDSKKELDPLASWWETMDLASLSEQLPDTEAFDETMRLPADEGSAQVATPTNESLATGIHSIQLHQEKDPKASQNTRLWIMVGLTSLIIAMVSFALVKSLGDKPLLKENLLAPTTILLAIVCIVLTVFHKRIFVNAYSKSFSMMLVFFALYLWIHRILALHRVNVGFSSILMDDLLLISALLAMGGVTVKTWLLPIAALQVVGALAMFFYPHAALPLMMGTGFMTMLLIIVLVSRGKG